MQHRDGYGTEDHRNDTPRTEASQEERDWALREYEQYYEKFASERDDDEVEQEEADHLYQSEDNPEEFEEEGRADHQEDHQAEFGAEDKAELTYTDIHFRYRKKAHGRINGKLWAPPSSKGLHTPVFVRLQDLQSQGPARGAAETPAVEVDASEGH